MKARNILAVLLLMAAGVQTAWGQGFRVYKSDGTVAQFSMRTDSTFTTSTWTTQNGVSGYKITSNYNDKSIFLPAAGYRNGTSLFSERYGVYWSRALYPSNSNSAASITFESEYIKCSFHDRCTGYCVRPVRCR